MRRGARWRATIGLGALLVAQPAGAHSGPPYPVVSNQITGAYRLSLWTDPDATDDGTPGGQFWVVIDSGRADALPPATRARVAVRPLDREQSWVEATAVPVDGEVSRQYVALRMDHEGPFEVHVVVDGPWGPATLDTKADATYDLRPPLPLLAVYLLPFLALGFLWALRLVRRRRARKP